MRPPDPLEIRLAQAWPPEAWQDVTTLVAVSGGADSVALLRALAALKTAGPGRLAAAHFNHGLRGRHSAADEAFVVDLCRQLGVLLETGHALGGCGPAGGLGPEALARRLRYDFFQQATQRLGARYLVTAHTADDQAETILHRIVRGTGIAGLAGIARVRVLGPAVTVVRPLLEVRRQELLEYLERLGQAYCVDHSNFDRRYTRNRIRHELLPELSQGYNHAVVESLVRLGSLAGEVQHVVAGLVASLADRAVRDGPAGGARIDRAALGGQPRYVVRELLMDVWRRRNWPLQAMGLAQWERLADLLLDAAPGTKMTLPGNVAAEVDAERLKLCRQVEVLGTTSKT